MYLWNKNRLTGIENRRVLAKGMGSGRGKDWEFGISKQMQTSKNRTDKQQGPTV